MRVGAKLAVLSVLILLSASIANSTQYTTGVALTAQIKKKPYDIMLSTNNLVIKMLPGAFDYRDFNITAYDGNTPTEVSFNFTDNLSKFFQLPMQNDTFSTNNTHFYTMNFTSYYYNSSYFNSTTNTTQTNYSSDNLVNLSVGNYTGMFNATVLDSGVSNYTNITFEVMNDSIGRVLVNVTDDSGQPVPDALVVVYYNLSVSEVGYTDSNGYYYTHFYDYKSYLLFSIQKTGYNLRGYSMSVTNPLNVLNSQLVGNPRLQWAYQTLTLSLPIYRTVGITIGLSDTGTSKETNVFINSSKSGIFTMLSKNPIPEIAAGQTFNVSLSILPKQQGIYSFYLSAKGNTGTIVSMLVNLLVGITTGGSTSTGTMLPTQGSSESNSTIPKSSSVQISISADGMSYVLPEGSALSANQSSQQNLMIIKKDFSKHFVITITNTGQSPIVNLGLTIDPKTDLNSVVYPQKYDLLNPGDSKNFVATLTGVSASQSDSTTIRVTANGFSALRTLNYAVIDQNVTLSDLSNQLSNYNITMSDLQAQVNSMSISGSDYSYLKSYISLINSKISTAQAALSAGDINSTTAMINDISSDMNILTSRISKLSNSKPDVMQMVFTAAAAIFLLILVLAAFKKRNKIGEYYSIVRRRLFMWWTLKKLR